MLSQIIITYVESSKIEPFNAQFQKIFRTLSRMDALRHCDPKVSPALAPLAEHFGVFTPDDISEMGSDLAESNAKVKAAQKRPLTSNFTK